MILTAPGRTPANDPPAGATAQVRWDGQGGTVHQATLAVPDGAAVGARIQLWLDSTGKVSAAPVTAGASAASAVFLGTLVLLAAAGLVTGAHSAIRTWADHTDDHHWEQDWRLFEPTWSHRA